MSSYSTRKTDQGFEVVRTITAEEAAREYRTAGSTVIDTFTTEAQAEARLLLLNQRAADLSVFDHHLAR